MSTVKGVYWDRVAQKWYSQILVNGRAKRLGYFATREDAAKKYAMAAKEHYGEYARLA